jgi:rhodanese-related sulfurtransferase
MSTTTITSDELHALLAGDRPHALLDVRERGAYERGHIFRATSLPRRALEYRLPALVTAHATPLVLYDDDGWLAGHAAVTLAEMGYTAVRVLHGGLAGWKATGRRIVQGVNVPSKVFGERVLHELKTPEIAPAALHARIAAGDAMVIVDSRTPEEYARGCVPGAISVPGGELVLRIADLVQRPDTTIVVHCGGRTRSYLGAESLRRMDLPNPIVALENGTMGWTLAGFELERGAARSAPAVSAKSRAVASLVAKRVAAAEHVAFVTPSELRTAIAARDRDNLYVLDVRTADEYVQGHVAGATWAPGGQAVQATDDYVAVRAARIVLVCDGFIRSVMTASWLGRMGLPNVGVLAGGLPAWVDAGGDIETGHPTIVPFGYEAARTLVRSVAPAALAAELDTSGPPIVIDVDQSDAYARGHVPGARWISRSRLEQRIVAAVHDTGQPVVVTCGDGLSSTLAAHTLGRHGHAGARVLDGGVRAWRAAGLPIETGATALADDPDDVVLKPYEKGRAAMEAYLRWEEALDAHGWSPVDLLPGAARKEGA